MAASVEPCSGQSLPARQSFTYARSTLVKPCACPSAYWAAFNDGSIAPSSTIRPTRQGNVCAYQAPMNVP